MSLLRTGGCLAAAVAVLLSGCSSSPHPAAAPPVAPAASTPSGPCDKAAFAGHAGLAQGAVHALVWKPFRAGAFKASAKDRATAMASGGRAGALASRELASAIAVVKGCPSAVTLLNALQTGVSLSASAGRQLSGGTLNPGTLGGVNSIVGTVSAQAHLLGITVTDQVPDRAQLASVA